ncbi:hypothetical protein [Methylobacterium indicum]|uniref:Uncharacterized protein n=1 Tax=Methylobacterium indicum TaxID=1775910 RepID=A0A8H9CA03_9HYPH|nr:hypothetical protein [Methylobacterium indicum]BCM87621.1 hypothetical protein mvi_60820 [Methylobacterium indicum]
MIGRVTLLSSALILAIVGSAEAQKLALPVGVWGHDGPKGPDCKKPFLKIEKKRIIQRFDEGEGRCVVKSLKPRGKYIAVKTKCDWDKGVPMQLREGADEADVDAFSIKIINKTKILFNNTDFGLCLHNAGSDR